MSTSKIGAFFDLDDTLFPKPSLEWRFLGHLLARDEITSSAALRWLGNWAKALLRNPRAAVDENKSYLCGLPESLARDWVNSLEPGSPQMFSEGLARMSWHITQQHQVFFVSGTPGFLARAIARSLPGPIEVIASELEVCGGYWTGRLAGEHMSGKAKCRAVRALAEQRGLRLERSYAYGDQSADLPMLEAVGHPFAVNPAARLRRIARKRGWPVCGWKALPAAAREECGQWSSVREAR
ncbi:MAG TPA: HAD-IB family hydrolase [Candidatus Acidoferrales bacterium]|nr:HAD-IB family hydrolase [Candidatus Acidoferrales bacterium]